MIRIRIYEFSYFSRFKVKSLKNCRCLIMPVKIVYVNRSSAPCDFYGLCSQQWQEWIYHLWKIYSFDAKLVGAIKLGSTNTNHTDKLFNTPLPRLQGCKLNHPEFPFFRKIKITLQRNIFQTLEKFAWKLLKLPVHCRITCLCSMNNFNIGAVHKRRHQFFEIFDPLRHHFV